MDVIADAGAAQRTVAAHTLPDGTEGVVATISRVYPTDQKDLWDACTDIERIPRWFLPVTGDLQVGGTYQLVGNANGTVESCSAPESFRATWEFGGGVSWIEVTLTPVDAEHTRFELVHTAPMPDRELWLQFGPGATGVGWDGALLGLGLHLGAPDSKVDPEEFQTWVVSPDGIAFHTAASEAWAEANIASGLATPEEAHAAAAATTAFYTTMPES